MSDRRSPTVAPAGDPAAPTSAAGDGGIDRAAEPVTPILPAAPDVGGSPDIATRLTQLLRNHAAGYDWPTRSCLTWASWLTGRAWPGMHARTVQRAYAAGVAEHGSPARYYRHHLLAAGWEMIRSGWPPRTYAAKPQDGDVALLSPPIVFDAAMFESAADGFLAVMACGAVMARAGVDPVQVLPGLPSRPAALPAPRSVPHPWMLTADGWTRILHARTISYWRPRTGS